MAHFCIRHPVISFFVLMFLLFSTSSYASKIVEINDICKQTMKNPSFCLSILNSKPGGAKGADLVSLSQYIIDVARDNITNTVNLIKSLIIESGNDPKAKAHYETCLVHFDDESESCALSDINYTQELLKKGDYGGVNIAASAVQTDVEDCISGESPGDTPYHDTSKLPQYADVIKQVVDIILIMSNYLVQN
ncbi:hypothetical protein Lal_00029866 [Lupinus albus]|uniref:Putative pectinesterase inhibitor domain-containing protein n=1 Tax=Lupinus albus TaxID=3870 RepID=A0A6A5MND0_LUPAL|nr:putative pectinesterase inhibitor domain-containing protein [Lupinus albus]KAF1874439.1 hypothetical protein Lal_00029866 [Lupinus albus]